MGDHGHNRHGRNGGVLCPFRGEFGSRLSPGPRSTSVPSGVFIHQPFDHNRQEPKTGAVPFLGGAATQSNTTSPGPTFNYLRTKWHLEFPSSRLATIDMGQQFGGVGVPFSGGSLVPIEHKVAWRRPTSVVRTKWHPSTSSRLATTDIGRKLGVCAPLGEGSWVPL